MSHPSPESADPASLLLVDDVYSIRHLLRRVIARRFPDADIHDATTNREAFDHLERSVPTCVVSDFQRCDENSIPLLVALTRRRIPTVLLSGTPYPKITRQFEEQGLLTEECFSVFVAKPMTPEEVSEAILAACSGSRGGGSFTRPSPTLVCSCSIR